MRKRSILLTLLAMALLGAGVSAAAAGAAAQKDPLGGNKKTLGEELARNPKLVAKLQPLLPQGMEIQVAAKDFKKMEVFAAALHAARNIGIPFEQIKARMILMDNLAKVIHTLDPTADAKAEARKAEAQAKEDLKG
jgi:hypothetical protein